MNGLFSYESKPMQILMRLGDLIILNLLYLLCCIPLFTIGAAQAGLYTAAKVMQDPEDDSSVAAAFFRGFRNGFGTVTIAWGITTIVLAAVTYFSIAAIMAGSPVWLAVVAIVFCMIFHALVPAFHARFSCTPWQLIRNSWFLLFAHPLRSIGTTILLWIPAALFVIDTFLFMALAPLWITLYYSAVFNFATSFLKKPFNTLIAHFNETHGITEETAPEASQEAEEEVSV